MCPYMTYLPSLQTNSAVQLHAQNMASCTSSLFRPFQSMQMISAEFRHGINIVSCMQSKYLRSGMGDFAVII